MFSRVLDWGVRGQGASLQQGVSGRTLNWRLRRGNGWALNLACGALWGRPRGHGVGPALLLGQCPVWAATDPASLGPPTALPPTPGAPGPAASLSGRGRPQGGPCWGPAASLEAQLATSLFLPRHIGGAHGVKDTCIQAGVQ